MTEQGQELELLERVKSLSVTSKEKFDEVGFIRLALKTERDNKFKFWYDSYQKTIKNMEAEIESFDLAIKKCQSAMEDYAAEQEMLELEAASGKEKEVLIAKAEKIEAKQDIEVVVLNLKKLCEEIAKGNIPTDIIRVEGMILKAWVKAYNKKNGDVPWLVIREVTKHQ